MPWNGRGGPVCLLCSGVGHGGGDRDQAVVTVVSGVAPGSRGLEKRGTDAVVAGEGAGGTGSGPTTVCVSCLAAENQGRF